VSNFTVTCSLDIVTARAFVTFCESFCLASVFEMTVYLLTYWRFQKHFLQPFSFSIYSLTCLLITSTSSAVEVSER